MMNRLLNGYDTGLPDLVLIKDGKLKFAEVKGPREKIMNHQKDWHRFLRLECNIDVDIIRISCNN